MKEAEGIGVPNKREGGDRDREREREMKHYSQIATPFCLLRTHCSCRNSYMRSKVGSEWTTTKRSEKRPRGLSPFGERGGARRAGMVL
jgi:hypothetical protein